MVTDKDVERNVRSSTAEGIRTPTERHVHGIGEQRAISFGEKSQAKKGKEVLLERFRRREFRKKGISAEKTGEGKHDEPGEVAGGGNPEE